MLTQDPDGDPQVLFDGFAQIPQTDLGPQTQSVTFAAVGVATRLWDLPILGRLQRNANNPFQVDGSADINVDLPPRFNPSDSSVGANAGYIGNRVSTDNFTMVDSGGDDGNSEGYPVFIDSVLIERDNESDGNLDETGYWWISDACKYLMVYRPSPTDEADNPYVVFPSFDALDAILSTYSPPDNGDLNSGDAVVGDTQIRDYDASHKTLPDALSICSPTAAS